MINKVLIDQKGNRYYWTNGDLNTPLGVLKEKSIKSGLIESHQGKKFYCFDATFVDHFEKIKRGGPAILVKKDVGIILSRTGIGKKSKVLDAGTGTGVLASNLANISDNVTSYEINKDFYEIAKHNIEFLGVKVKQKLKDITQGIDEKDLDLITLDLPEPWLIFDHAKKALKSGGFLVCYLPNITQVMRAVDNIGIDFVVDCVSEIIEREWHVEGKKVRPKNQGLLHTAFLVFLRRV